MPFFDHINLTFFFLKQNKRHEFEISMQHENLVHNISFVFSNLCLEEC